MQSDFLVKKDGETIRLSALSLSLSLSLSLTHTHFSELNVEKTAWEQFAVT